MRYSRESIVGNISGCGRIDDLARIVLISLEAECAIAGMSLPSRGRGSKLRRGINLSRLSKSLPSRGRGSKHTKMTTRAVSSSRSLHGGVDRNLASPVISTLSPCRSLHGGVDRNVAHGGGLSGLGWSLPSRGRGSKRYKGKKRPPRMHVAPFTGAWIETRYCTSNAQRSGVAPFTGAWIETASRLWSRPAIPSRSLHGGVDRNARVRCRSIRLLVAPFTGAWIETLMTSRTSASCGGRSLHGGVDRNIAAAVPPPTPVVAPFTGAWIETPRCASISNCQRVAPFTGAWIET